VLSGSGLTTGRYLRLLGLAVGDSFLCIFITHFSLLARLIHYSASIKPVRSWESVHHNFSLISQLPEESQDGFFSITVIAVPFYIGPLYSIVFFIFFGFGEETVAEYVAMWRKVSSLWSASR